MVAYGHDETARLAKDMPRKDLTVTQDETFTGGLCLLTMDPESNFIILEQLAQTRDHVMWNELMAPALAPLNCRVMQSTSDEAPGLLAYVEHYLEAHHSPDLFHVQHELIKAVCGPMATKEALQPQSPSCHAGHDANNAWSPTMVSKAMGAVRPPGRCGVLERLPSSEFRDGC